MTFGTGSRHGQLGGCGFVGLCFCVGVDGFGCEDVLENIQCLSQRRQKDNYVQKCLNNRPI